MYYVARMSDVLDSGGVTTTLVDCLGIEIGNAPS